jgi:PAS domain S-box-containing protein
MLAGRHSDLTHRVSDSNPGVPRWLLVSNLLLWLLVAALLFLTLGNRVYGSNLSLVALAVGLLAIAFSVGLHLRLWSEGRERARDMERGLDAVFEHALDAILTLDDQAVCIDANPAAFAILGASRSVLVGHSFKQFYESPQEFERLWRLFLDCKRYKGNARLVRPDGSRVFAHYTLAANYAPGYHVMILCDTTERVEALDSLRQREELLQQISDNIREIVWTLDARTKEILFVNGAYADITGRSPGSLLRHPSSYMEIIHPLDRASVLAKLDDAVHTGHFEEEFRIVRLDSEVRWVRVSSSPVRERGKIVRLVGSVQDISNRKTAERQLALHLAAAEAARKQADDARAEAEAAKEQADDARAEAEALHKAALTLTEDLRMDTVLDRLLETLFEIVPYDVASVILTEDETRDRLFVAREAPASPAGRSIVTLETANYPLLQRVLLLKKNVHLGDTREEVDWRSTKALGDVRSWIAVPLVASDNVFGLLSLGKSEPRAFTTEHFRLAKSLAIPAAVAIHNARLYEWAQIYAKERQTLLKKIEEKPQSEGNPLPPDRRFAN